MALGIERHSPLFSELLNWRKSYRFLRNVLSQNRWIISLGFLQNKNNINEYSLYAKNWDLKEYSTLIVAFVAISLKHIFNSLREIKRHKSIRWFKSNCNVLNFTRILKSERNVKMCQFKLEMYLWFKPLEISMSGILKLGQQSKHCLQSWLLYFKSQFTNSYMINPYCSKIFSWWANDQMVSVELFHWLN